MRRLGHDVWLTTTYRLKFVELRRNSVENVPELILVVVVVFFFVFFFVCFLFFIIIINQKESFLCSFYLGKVRVTGARQKNERNKIV